MEKLIIEYLKSNNRFLGDDNILVIDFFIDNEANCRVKYMCDLYDEPVEGKINIWDMLMFIDNQK
jgi:hypothetical protein